jgi:predicted nuclease with TOPRIM domain
MLEVAELRRNEKRKIDKELGYFTDNFRKYVEGSGLTNIKERLKSIEKTLAKLEEEKKKAGGNTSEYICLLSSYEFKNKVISLRFRN